MTKNIFFKQHSELPDIFLIFLYSYLKKQILLRDVLLRKNIFLSKLMLFNYKKYELLANHGSFIFSWKEVDQAFIVFKHIKLCES